MPSVIQVAADAPNQQILIQIIDSVTGQQVAGTNLIQISLQDVAALGSGVDGKTRTVRLQWRYWKDSSTCNPMRAITLMSDPEPDPTNGGQTVG